MVLIKAKKIYKKIRKKIGDYSSNKNHLREKNLKKLPKLSEVQRTEIKKIWGNLGNIEFKYWQYYLKMTGDFNKYYIPDNIWFNKICPFFNNASFSKQIDDKALYDLFININMPETICRIIGGRFLDKDFNVINGNLELIFEKEQKFICKPAVNSYGGKGIVIIDKNNYDKIKKLDLKMDWVIQKFVIQSKNLSFLNSSCINTVRIGSFMKKNGDVVILGAMLRMGINGALVDNASAGGIFVGIDILTGNLKEYAYSLSKEKLIRFEKHPNSNVVFSNYHISGFEKIIQIIKCNAKYFPRNRIIGWDFTLDENENPILIELNLENHGCVSLQLANGPYCGEFISSIIDEIGD